MERAAMNRDGWGSRPRPAAPPRGRYVAAGVALGVSALVGVGLAACTWTDVRPSGPKYEKLPPLVGSAAGSAQASAGASALPSAPIQIEPEDEDEDRRGQAAASQLVASLAGPRIRIGDVKGASPEAAGLIFAPVEEPIQACASRGGVLTVSIVTKEGKTAVEVMPGSNVEPEARKCVLKALNGFEPGATMPTSSSPSEKLREFSSVLTIQW